MFSPDVEIEQAHAGWDGRIVSRDQILTRKRGQGNFNLPCSADHEEDWQPYPVDPCSAISDDHTYMHTTIRRRNANLCFVTDHRSIFNFIFAILLARLIPRILSHAGGDKFFR